MNRKCVFTIAALALASGPARADFTYEQSTKITGGAMAGMMKVAGAFSKQAREPMRATISVKGDRMSMNYGNRISIIDLAAETMTDVDLEKKTYAVITFADFGRAMQKASEKMGQKSDAQIQFKADLKQTGESRNINGFPAKEAILTLIVEGQDQKSGKTGAMNLVTHMWLAPNVSGYEEVKNFYTKMGQKLAYTPGMSGMAGMMGQQAGMAKGMAELSKEAAKLEGVPVLQVVRMGGTAEGMSEADLARAQQAQQQAPPPPTAGEMAGGAAAGAAAGRMGRIGGLAGGLGGGLGGFGRKKKEPEQPAAQTQQQAPPPAAQPASPAGPTPPGTLMEMTTEITSFSAAPVDMAKLSVPGGFKQVEHDIAKQLK